MRIALLVHQFLPKYSSGTEILTLQMAQEFMRRGYEVTVICGEPLDREPIPVTPFSQDSYQGISVFRISTHNQKQSPILRDFSSQPQVDIIYRFLQDWQPDVVHINHCLHLSTQVIPAIKSLGIPVIYSATDFWLICPSLQLLKYNNKLCQGPDKDGVECLRCYLSGSSKPQIIQWSRNFPDPVLKTAMRMAGSVSQTKIPPSKLVNALQAFPQRQEQILEHLKATDSIVVATDIMLELFVNNGLPREKIIKLGYGIEPLAKILPKQQSNTLNFGYIGTLSPHKGADLLIKAFQSLPRNNALLKIYGDVNHSPSYSQHLLSLAELNPNIMFMGTFPSSQIANVLAELDFLVVPSRWYENTPLVIHAALQAGVPVIAADLGGMSELVINEQNGLLFFPEDFSHLASQMQRCLDNPDITITLKENLNNNKSKTMSQYIDELSGIYQNL